MAIEFGLFDHIEVRHGQPAHEQAKVGAANYFMLTLPFGDLTSEEASRTLEGFVTEVIPAVREVEAAGALV